MAQLIVRNVEEAVVRALKLRAAKEGRSAEAQHRELLRQALMGPQRPSFKEALLAMPSGGSDVHFARSRSLARKVKL